MLASGCYKQGLVVVQAHVGQQTERATSAEAQVASLNQEVRSRSSEGLAWFQQLQQAQQDLLAAQVFTVTCLAAVSLLCLVLSVCHGRSETSE